MKKINIYSPLLIILIAIAVLNSCKKNFLDKQPLDAISGQTFWKTADDAQKGLAGVYGTLKNGYYGYNKVYLDALTDNAFHQFDYNNLTTMAYGNYNPTIGVVNTVWITSYQGISACNIFLKNVPNISMDATLKNQELAEVKFLRAFYYFTLVSRYGDVILYSEPPTLADANVALTPKAQVLTFIKTDLDFAVANLPDAAYNGHVVKGTALALQARIALFNQDWSTASTLANQVISSGKFSLYSDYRGLFFKKFQENNPEIMFSTKYLAPNDQQGYYNGMDLEIGFYAAIDPYQEMVDAYETKDGKAITDPASGYSRANQYANRDPRLHASIRGSDQVWRNPNGTIFNNSDPSPTGYQQSKYIDTTLFPVAYGDLNKEDVGVIHIRYADVLLMYAEAKNELSGPDNSIFAALNLIRTRAGMPAVDQTKYGSQTTLRDFIRHERRIELAFEGLRYDDLVRWKNADKVMPTVVNPGKIPVKFSANFYLWPIPQNEFTVDPLIKQNPGY